MKREEGFASSTRCNERHAGISIPIGENVDSVSAFMPIRAVTPVRASRVEK